MEYVIYNFEDIAKISAGGDAPKEFSSIRTQEFPYPIYSNGLENEGLYGYGNKARIKGNSITISARGVNIGTVFYRKEKFWPIVRLISLEPNDNVCSKYLYYYLKSINIIGTGSAQPQIPVPYLAKQKVKIFKDIKYQQKIASILSAYDDLIEKNNRRMEILRGSAEELYKEWFVRFRFPNHQNTKFINGIPQGWEIKRLGEVAKISTGKCNREDAEENGIYPLFDRSQEIKKSSSWIKDCEAIIVPGEGMTFIPRYFVGKFNLHQRCYCIEPKENHTGKYLYYTLLLNRAYFLSVATGATVPSLRQNNFTLMKIILPTKEILLKFKENVGKIFDTILLLQNQNELLKQQRDLLLPRLMSGKINVTP